MLDPLSVIASAITIGEVGAHLSLALFKVARTIKNARKEIAEIASEMSAVSSTLKALGSILHNNRDLCKPELFEQIENILSRFNEVKAKIECLTGPKSDQRGRGRTLKRLKWLLEGPKARNLLKTVESIKSGLVLILSVVQIALEERRYRQSSGAIQYPIVPDQRNNQNYLENSNVNNFRKVAESLVQTSRLAVENAQAESDYNPTEKRRRFDEDLQRWHKDSSDSATWLYRLVFDATSPPYQSEEPVKQKDRAGSSEFTDSDFDERDQSARTSTCTHREEMIAWNRDTEPSPVVDRLLHTWTWLTQAEINASRAAYAFELDQTMSAWIKGIDEDLKNYNYANIDGLSVATDSDSESQEGIFLPTLEKQDTSTENSGMESQWRQEKQNTPEVNQQGHRVKVRFADTDSDLVTESDDSRKTRHNGKRQSPNPFRTSYNKNDAPSHDARQYHSNPFHPTYRPAQQQYAPLFQSNPFAAEPFNQHPSSMHSFPNPWTEPMSEPSAWVNAGLRHQPHLPSAFQSHVVFPPPSPPPPPPPPDVPRAPDTLVSDLFDVKENTNERSDPEAELPSTLSDAQLQKLKDFILEYTSSQIRGKVADLEGQGPATKESVSSEALLRLENVFLAQQMEQMRRQEQADAAWRATRSETDAKAAKDAEETQELMKQEVLEAQAAKKAAEETLNLVKEQAEKRAQEAAELKALRDRNKDEEDRQRMIRTYEERLAALARERKEMGEKELRKDVTLPSRHTLISQGSRRIEVSEYGGVNTGMPFSAHAPLPPLLQNRGLHGTTLVEHLFDQPRDLTHSSLHQLASFHSTSNLHHTVDSNKHEQIRSLILLPPHTADCSRDTLALRASLGHKDILASTAQSTDDTFFGNLKAPHNAVLSTIFWEPPQLPSSSELLGTLRYRGWKPFYVRISEAGQTYFLGDQPIHVHFFRPDYKPQFTACRQESDVECVLIAEDLIEEDALMELGIESRSLTTGAYVLDGRVTWSDIEYLVERSFSIREMGFRRQYRQLQWARSRAATVQSESSADIPHPTSAYEELSPSLTSDWASTTSVTDHMQDQSSVNDDCSRRSSITSDCFEDCMSDLGHLNTRPSPAGAGQSSISAQTQ